MTFKEFTVVIWLTDIYWMILASIFPFEVAGTFAPQQRWMTILKAATSLYFLQSMELLPDFAKNHKNVRNTKREMDKPIGKQASLIFRW